MLKCCTFRTSLLDLKRVSKSGNRSMSGLPRGGHPPIAHHGRGQEKFAGHRSTF